MKKTDSKDAKQAPAQKAGAKAPAKGKPEPEIIEEPKPVIIQSPLY